MIKGDVNPKNIELFKPAYRIQKYQQNIGKIQEYHSKVWGEHRQQHKLYTDHGKKHSDNIIKKISDWLSNKSFEHLNLYRNESAEASAFILLIAIYLHDIGMQCNKDLYKFFFPQEAEDIDKMNGDGLDFLEKVRKKHNLLSKGIILKSLGYGEPNNVLDFLKLQTTEDVQKEMEAVSLLCASHCDPIPDGISSDIKEEYFLDQQCVNLRRLMYILRVGDALDANYSRINKDLFDQKNCWKELKNSKNPQYLIHIFKHYVVDRIDVNTFEFHYSLPSDHPKLNDEEFQEDCQVFIEAALRRNHKFYSNHMRELKIDFPEPSSRLWEKRSNKPTFPELPNEALEWLHREAKRLRTNQTDDCLNMAKEKLFIAGQNLFFVSNPTRYTNGDLKREHFHDLFFARLREDKSFKIRILILNPKAEELVNEWHNKLIENWRKTPNLERSKEHQKIKPNFKGDLNQSFDTFRKWQEEIQKLFRSLNWSSSSIKSCPEDYPLLVKCVSQRIDSTNIVDPEKRNPKRNESLVNITHKWDEAIEDAQGRRTITYDKFDNKTEVEKLWNYYNELFEKGEYILDVKFKI
jgi:hypothetical protein